MSSALATLRTFQSAEHGEEQEDIACPLCGEHDPKPTFIARDLLFASPGGYPFVRCARCDMQYVSPRPTGAALGRHYPDDYFGYSLHEDEPAILRPFLRAMARDISLRRIRYLEAVAGRIAPDAKLLDVGCGANRLLQTIRDERGCLGTALDFKPEVVSYVRDKLQMPIVQGSLATAGLPEASFDVVWMMEYLEHELDPRRTLQEARHVLKAGGHLALELPYIAWPGRLFGRYWWNLDIPRHLIFFTPETLAKMLDQCGFTMMKVQPFTLPLYVGMSMVQALGLRHWRKHKNLYPLLSTVLALPLMPFAALMPEFMFVVARAK